MTLLVVIGHVCRIYSPYSIIKLEIGNSILNNIASFIYSFHMPAFVFISGVIYYYIKRDLKRYNNEFKFINKKVLRLIVPYIFFSLFIVIPTLYFLDLIKINLFKYIINNYILCLDNRHLWYLIMLFGVFIIFNHYEKYLYKYYYILFPLLFIVSICHQLITPYFGASNIAYYFIYFYLGYLYGKNKSKIYPFFTTYLLPIIGISGFLLLFFWFINTIINDKIYLCIINYITAILGTILIYSISIKLSSNTKIIKNKTIINLNKNSYAIYLFHPMIIYLLFSILAKQSSIKISSFLIAFMILIASIIASLILTYFFRKIKLNLVIGENINSK